MNRTNNNKNKEKLADSDHHRKTTTTNILVVRVEVTVVLEVLQYTNIALAVAVRWIGRNEYNKE